MKCAQGGGGSIHRWPTTRTLLRHILAISVPWPRAGARWLLPLADPVMLQQGEHQPSLRLAPAPQPLQPEPYGVQLGAPCLPCVGSSIPAAHRHLAQAWLNLHSHPSERSRSASKTLGAAESERGLSQRSLLTVAPYAGGVHSAVRGGGCALAKLLPTAAEPSQARQQPRLPAPQPCQPQLTSHGERDRAETLPGAQPRAAAV